METIIYEDIKWADSVNFSFGERKHKGIVTIIDKYGGGIYSGVCTSYDILAEDGAIYKHIPHNNINKIQVNQLTDNLIRERNEMLKRRDDYINKKIDNSKKQR